MADQIKPRYRLGTQNMLDLAKDDATKIPKRTLFRVAWPYASMYRDALVEGDIVVRREDENGLDDENSVGFPTLDDENSVGFSTIDGSRWHFSTAHRLQPLI